MFFFIFITVMLHNILLSYNRSQVKFSEVPTVPLTLIRYMFFGTMSAFENTGFQLSFEYYPYLK